MEEKTIYNIQQLTAVEFPPKPLLIIAGAGTGKTTTIVGRMAYFIDELHIRPNEILALTFTVKAAEHLKQKLIHEIGEQGGGIHASNFHSFAQQISLEFKDYLGYSKTPTLMSENDIYFMLREHFDDLEVLVSTSFKRNPIEAIASFKSCFDRFRDDLLTYSELDKIKIASLECAGNIDDHKKAEPYLQLVDAINVFPKYQQWKQESNRIDYGDMIQNCWKLIQNEPQVLAILQNRFKHIIIDEFQDNNYALSQIMFEIAKPNNSITVVGDDDQSIYSFRGANIQNVHEFVTRYSKVDGYSKIQLKQNYRSVQPILDIANKTIQFNPDRMEKEYLFSGRESKELPVIAIGSKYSQVEYIANSIKELVDRGCQPNEIAILTRTHKQCRDVNELLMNHHILTNYVSGKLFDKAVIVELVCLLNLINNVNANELLLVYLIDKKIGQNISRLITQTKWKTNKYSSLLDFCTSSSNKISKNGTNYCMELQNLIAKSKNNPIQNILWDCLIFNKSYFKLISSSPSVVSTLDVQCLNEFQKIVREYVKQYNPQDLEAFCRYLNVLYDMNKIDLPISEGNYSDNAIQLMSVHASKGKEFKHVFIPFVYSAGFPLNNTTKAFIDNIMPEWKRWNISDKSRKELHSEEERRIFYVAVTRAQKKLTLCTTPKRQSKYIKELDDKLIRKVELMENSTEVNIFNKLKNEFQVKLLAETNAGNTQIAIDIVNAIEKIDFLSHGKTVKWEGNPFKKQILDAVQNIENTQVPNLTDLQLSASQIDTYKKCSMQYKFKYIDHIPGRGEKPYLNLGNVIHAVLQDFHTKSLTTFEELEILLKEKWTSAGYEFTQEESQHYDDALQMLQNYINYLDGKTPPVFTVEDYFIFETMNCKVSGKCDRIDVTEEGEIHIYDYKTSKNPKSEKDLKKDTQLGIYALYCFGAEKVIEDGRKLGKLPEKLSLLFLRENNPEVSISFTEEELSIFSKLIEETADKIRNKEFTCNDGHHCNYCDYKNLLCPIFTVK